MPPLPRLSVLYWLPPYASIKHLFAPRPSCSTRTLACVIYSFFPIPHLLLRILACIIYSFFPITQTHPSCLSPQTLTSFSENTADEWLMLLTVSTLPFLECRNRNCESKSSSRKKAGHGSPGGGQFLKDHRGKGIWPMLRFCCSIRYTG